MQLEMKDGESLMKSGRKMTGVTNKQLTRTRNIFYTNAP